MDKLDINNSRGFRVVSKISDCAFHELLDRILNHGQWDEKPLPSFHQSAEAVVQFYVQASAAKKFMYQRFKLLPIDVREFECRYNFYIR